MDGLNTHKPVLGPITVPSPISLVQPLPLTRPAVYLALIKATVFLKACMKGKLMCSGRFPQACFYIVICRHETLHGCRCVHFFVNLSVYQSIALSVYICTVKCNQIHKIHYICNTYLHCQFNVANVHVRFQKYIRTLLLD